MQQLTASKLTCITSIGALLRSRPTDCKFDAICCRLRVWMAWVQLAWLRVERTRCLQRQSAPMSLSVLGHQPPLRIAPSQLSSPAQPIKLTYIE